MTPLSVYIAAGASDPRPRARDLGTPHADAGMQRSCRAAYMVSIFGGHTPCRGRTKRLQSRSPPIYNQSRVRIVPAAPPASTGSLPVSPLTSLPASQNLVCH